MITKLSTEELMKCQEPTDDEIRVYMEYHGETYYSAREYLREQAYGGKPPGFQSWGDYWKSF